MRGVTRSSGPLLAALVAATAAVVGAQEDEHREEEPEERHLEHVSHHGGFPTFGDLFFTHHAYLEWKVSLQVEATAADDENEFEEFGEPTWRCCSTSTTC